MSYPKKHPTQSSDARAVEKHQKQEQLRSIILSKFKTKYGSAVFEPEVEKLIREGVD